MDAKAKRGYHIIHGCGCRGVGGRKTSTHNINASEFGDGPLPLIIYDIDSSSLTIARGLPSKILEVGSL